MPNPTMLGPDNGSLTFGDQSPANPEGPGPVKNLATRERSRHD